MSLGNRWSSVHGQWEEFGRVRLVSGWNHLSRQLQTSHSYSLELWPGTNTNTDTISLTLSYTTRQVNTVVKEVWIMLFSDGGEISTCQIYDVTSFQTCSTDRGCLLLLCCLFKTFVHLMPKGNTCFVFCTVWKWNPWYLSEDSGYES